MFPGKNAGLSFYNWGLPKGTVLLFFVLAPRGQDLRLEFGMKVLASGVYLKELCYFLFFLLLVARFLD